MRRKTSVSQEAELIRVILTDETIGTIYLKEKMLGEYSRQEIAEMLEERYSDSSESTCLRRATCVRAWINWIDSKLLGKFCIKS